jgi:hypothetical protein
LRELLDGRFAYAVVTQAELLAGPVDVDVDFNWPEEKLFRVADVPEGCRDGDRVILGDGEGGRMDATLVARDGQLGFLSVAGTYRNSTADLWVAAFDEATSVAEAP